MNSFPTSQNLRGWASRKDLIALLRAFPRGPIVTSKGLKHVSYLEADTYQYYCCDVLRSTTAVAESGSGPQDHVFDAQRNERITQRVAHVNVT